MTPACQELLHQQATAAFVWLCVCTGLGIAVRLFWMAWRRERDKRIALMGHVVRLRQQRDGNRERLADLLAVSPLRVPTAAEAKAQVAALVGGRK